MRKAPQEIGREVVLDIPGLLIPAADDYGISLVVGRTKRVEIAAHRHDELQLSVLCHPVVGVFRSEETATSFCVRGPAVVMIAPQYVHSSSFEREGDAVVVYLPANEHRRLLPEGAQGITVAQASGAQDVLFWQMVAMVRGVCVDNHRNDPTLLHLLAESLSRRAIDIVTRGQSVVARPVRALTPERLQKVEEFVQAQLRYDIHVDDMAKCAGYSVPHFSILFKNAKGMTPAEYLFRCRMIRAEELLRSGNHFIGEVAKLVGYLDQSHFTGLFLDYFGYPPKAVLAQIRSESSYRPNI